MYIIFLTSHNNYVIYFKLGGYNLRQLTEGELLSLTGLLKMEKDGLTVTKAIHSLITDDDLRRQAEAGILATESRVKGIQQFINENQITLTGGVQ